jgi:hypothetical protein
MPSPMPADATHDKKLHGHPGGRAGAAARQIMFEIFKIDRSRPCLLKRI